jgi:hypothetical protein
VDRDNTDGFLSGCTVLRNALSKPFCLVFATAVYISLAYIYFFSPTEENHQGVL